MKSGKLWMTIFLVPIFALLQILVIYQDRIAAENEAKVYEKQLDLYSQNRQAVIEMTGRQSPAEVEKTLEDSELDITESGSVDVIKIRRVSE